MSTTPYYPIRLKNYTTDAAMYPSEIAMSSDAKTLHLKTADGATISRTLLEIGTIAGTAYDGAAGATLETSVAGKLSKAGDTMSGALTISNGTDSTNFDSLLAQGNILAGGSTNTSYTLVGSVRKCSNDSNTVNLALFFVNSDGTAKFSHKINNTSGKDDSYMIFNNTGFKVAYSGTAGTAASDEYTVLDSNNGYLKTAIDALLSLKAPLASPTFTETPTAPTAVSGTNTTQLATTAFVQTAIGSISYPALSLASSGSGNAITSLSVSGHAITIVKGSTFLTAHPSVSTLTDTTTTTAPAFGGSFTAVDGVTRDAYGHVTNINTKTVKIPTQTSLSVSSSGSGTCVSSISVSGHAITVVKDITPSTVSTITYTCSIATSWSGSSAPYTQNIAVSGILSTDNPIVDLNLNGVAYADKENISSAWSSIYRIVTYANGITVYADEATTTAVPIQLKVVRS